MMDNSRRRVVGDFNSMANFEFQLLQNQGKFVLTGDNLNTLEQLVVSNRASVCACACALHSAGSMHACMKTGCHISFE